MRNVSKPEYNEKTKGNETEYAALEPERKENIMRLWDGPFEIRRKERLIGEITALKISRSDTEYWGVGNHFLGGFPDHDARSK